jgi:GT2 family glycosyltransferase
VNDATKALTITVNFQHPECTLQFLKSASRLESFSACHVAIVDNNSADDSVRRLRKAVSEFRNVQLLESPRNRGYFGGAKWALEQYLAQHSIPDWVIVCNNDIVFEDPRFLSRLLEKDPMAAGVIAPAIVSGLTGYDANPSIRRRPGPIRMLRYRFWLSNYYTMWLKQWLSPFVRRVRYRFSLRRASRNAASREIYAPHGSFLIFSRKFFEVGGFIDDGFFLYAEEFCVAEMCRRLGLPVIHDSGLRVWHEEGQSTGRMLSRSLYQHEKKGFRYALDRYKDGYRGLGLSQAAVKTAMAQKQRRLSSSLDC